MRSVDVVFFVVMAIGLWGHWGCTTVVESIDDYGCSASTLFTERSFFDWKLRLSSDENLLEDIAINEKWYTRFGLSPNCPIHGCPDAAISEYVAEVVRLSTNLVWQADKDISGAYWLRGKFLSEIDGFCISHSEPKSNYYSRGRLLALAYAENPLPRKCKYWKWVEDLRLSASSNLCEREMRAKWRQKWNLK